MIDIGANLAHDCFDADRDALLERAKAAGLAHIVITGSSLASARRALELARAQPDFLSATAGLHPHHASEWNAEHEAVFRECAADPRCVSLGECGLDYFRDLSPREDQRRAFAAQLALAAELNKPLFLHQRDAHLDFLPMLREHRPQLGAVVVHCFTDTREAMESYVALGCHIGITGWVCDAKRGAALREGVPHIPADRLMVETDAPYLLPHNLPKAQRGADRRRNEPAFLPWILRALAELRGVDEAALAAQTSHNARRFFGL